LRAYADKLKYELDHYKSREEHFVKVLDICDGGQYRNDWDERLKAVIKENKKLRPRCAELEALIPTIQEEAKDWRDEVMEARTELANILNEARGPDARQVKLDAWSLDAMVCSVETLIEDLTVQRDVLAKITPEGDGAEELAVAAVKFAREYAQLWHELTDIAEECGCDGKDILAGVQAVTYDRKQAWGHVRQLLHIIDGMGDNVMRAAGATKSAREALKG